MNAGNFGCGVGVDCTTPVKISSAVKKKHDRKRLGERIESALWSMLLLGGETKTGRLCHTSHTDGLTMASRNPETKQHHKVLMLKDRVQAIQKSQQGQSV